MKKPAYFYFAIFAISCSVLIFETVLLKFSSLKLMDSWAFLVISIAFLGIGASGTYLYLRKRETSPDINFSFLAKFSTAYTISIPLSIIIFALMPLAPPSPGEAIINVVSYQGVLFNFLYMIIFAIPFFLSGVCISYILSLKNIHVGRILFFDLMGAGFGAIFTILFLGALGGYGIMAVAMAFAYLASLIFLKEFYAGASFNSGQYGARYIEHPARYKLKIFGGHFLLFSFFLSCLLIYPSAMIKARQFDIISPKIKGAYGLFMTDFNGVGATYWDPIARIDLSKEGASDSSSFLFGLAPNYRDKKYIGRYILVDSGCMTRQFRIYEDESKNEFLGHFLFSIPYRLKEEVGDVLVIGAGGGVEVLVAKHFKAKRVDVAEINSATVNILKGKNKNDKLSSVYSGFTSSNKDTTINYYHEEGRSFISKNKTSKYDILQLTGVDLLLALKSGGLVLSENYLYTQEALTYYYDALKDGGYAQIVYWSGPYSLRLFITAIAMLESKGEAEPYRSLMAVTDNQGWTNLIIKKGFFSDKEMQEVRKMAEADGLEVIFDSEVKREHLEQISLFWQGKVKEVTVEYGPGKKGSYLLATMKESEYPEVDYLRRLPLDLNPTHDDKPFFYSIYKPNEWGLAEFEEDALAVQNKVAQKIIFTGAILAFLLIVLPLFLKNQRATQSGKTSIPVELIIFFGIVGIAFSLFEVILIQKFSVFAGGPLYAMAVTLPAILIFYSLGALCTSKIKIPRLQLLSIAIGGIILYGLAGSLFFDHMIKSLFYLGQWGRILITIVAVAPAGFLIGFPTPLVLEAIKGKIDENIVPVMWGTNSCGNVIGALFFVAIAQKTGFNLLLLISSLLYLLALIFIIPKLIIWQK